MNLANTQQEFEEQCKNECTITWDSSTALQIKLSANPRKYAHVISKISPYTGKGTGTYLYSHAYTLNGIIKMVNYYLKNCI